MSTTMVSLSLIFAGVAAGSWLLWEAMGTIYNRELDKTLTSLLFSATTHGYAAIRLIDIRECIAYAYRLG